jgi:transcriptional regulator with XRE-family HTH domain
VSDGLAALRAAIKRSGVTQRAAAAACGLTEKTVGDWLGGRVTPFHDNLAAFCAVIGAPELVEQVAYRQRHVALIPLACMRCHQVLPQIAAISAAYRAGRNGHAVYSKEA